LAINDKNQTDRILKEKGQAFESLDKKLKSLTSLERSEARKAASEGIADLFDPAVVHRGGVIGRDSLSTRAMPVSAFESAPRFHSGRLPWNPSFEMPAVIRKDETVLTPGQADTFARLFTGLGAGMRGQQPNVNVNIYWRHTADTEKDYGGIGSTSDPC